MAIQIKRSTTPGSVPNSASLQVGELAVNTADAKLWTKHSSGSLVDLNPTGSGGGSTLTNVDGGNASSSYNTSGIIDGGNSGG